MGKTYTIESCCLKLRIDFLVMSESLGIYGRCAERLCNSGEKVGWMCFIRMCNGINTFQNVCKKSKALYGEYAECVQIFKNRKKNLRDTVRCRVIPQLHLLQHASIVRKNTTKKSSLFKLLQYDVTLKMIGFFLGNDSLIRNNSKELVLCVLKQGDFLCQAIFSKIQCWTFTSPHYQIEHPNLVYYWIVIRVNRQLQGRLLHI